MAAYATRPSALTAIAGVFPPRHRLPRPLMIAMTVSTIGFIILNMHLPVAIFADAGFDDALFLTHAESITGGHWLGPYSQMTFAKGPGYPIFLAINAILGVPVTLTQALLYSLACASLTITLFRIFGAAWVCFLGFLFMQWHPGVFPLRIVRDDVSAAQVLLILSCVCHFVFLPTALPNRLRWAASGGFVLGWFWMTREDALWVLPGLAVICGLQALQLFPVWQEVKRLAASIAVFGLATAATLAVVASINLMVYGTFAIADVKNPQFAKALDVLQSVRVGEPVPYVPVPAKVRQKLDMVSPAFASLEPYFHGPGQIWTEPGCGVYPSTCNDFAGGWFMWALRDAVASQGYYATPAAAASFYQRLWTQVDDACKAGRLECRSSFLPFMPGMRSDQWNQLPAKLQRMYGLAIWQDGQTNWLNYTRALLRSTGGAAQVQQMVSFLGRPLSAPLVFGDMSSSVSGWFRAPDNLWLRARCDGAQGEIILPVVRQPSQDLVKYFNSPDAVDLRFDVALPSLVGCVLEPVPVSPANGYLALGTATTGVTALGGGTLGIDNLNRGNADNPGRRAVGLLAQISWFYAWFTPGATILALLVYALSLLWGLWRYRWRCFDAQLIIVTSIGTLLLVRAFLLVLVDISSFPGISQSYWVAGYPLLSLAIVLSLARFSLRGKA